MIEEIEELLRNCILQSAELSEQDVDALQDLGSRLGNHVTELTEMYRLLSEETLPKSNSLNFEQNGDSYSFLDTVVNFNRAELLAFLAIVIDVFSDVLPLGSVVDLKKEYLKDSLPIDKIKNVRIVITHRFLHNPKSQFYFPYAGVVYPLGSMGNERTIHFTSPFINTVVHTGYSDEQDEAYVLLMKQEMLLNRHLRSYSFASKEDIAKEQGSL